MGNGDNPSKRLDTSNNPTVNKLTVASTHSNNFLVDQSTSACQSLIFPDQRIPSVIS